MKNVIFAGGAALLVATALGGPAAMAEEGVAMKNLLGDMGIIPKEKDPIRYRERAPLVLPPKMDLREPASASYSSGNPQWPKDPDVARRRERAITERRPATDSEVRRMADRRPELTVDEIRAGRSAGNDAAAVPGTHRGDNARDVLYANSAQQGIRKDEEAESAVPVRRTLADPPTGFRRNNGTGAVAGYEPKVDQQERDANPINWLTQKFKRSSDDD